MRAFLQKESRALRSPPWLLNQKAPRTRCAAYRKKKAFRPADSCLQKGVSDIAALSSNPNTPFYIYQTYERRKPEAQAKRTSKKEIMILRFPVKKKKPAIGQGSIEFRNNCCFCHWRHFGAGTHPKPALKKIMVNCNPGKTVSTDYGTPPSESLYFER